MTFMKCFENQANIMENYLCFTNVAELELVAFFG